MKLPVRTSSQPAIRRISRPQAAASVAGGRGIRGSRPVHSLGVRGCPAGSVGKVAAWPKWFFAGGDLPLRRRRSGGVPQWIYYLRRARSSVQLPWATSPLRSSRMAIPAFVDTEAAGFEASKRCGRWSRMEVLRSSRTDSFPSAKGHLPIQGVEDAAAARRRNVLLIVGIIALQKMDLCVILCFVEVLSVKFLL